MYIYIYSIYYILYIYIYIYILLKPGDMQHKSAVYKDHKILITLKRCITLSLSFQTRNTKFVLFHDCRTYENNFSLFDDSTNKTKPFNLKVNCKEHKHVNTLYIYMMCKN